MKFTRINYFIIFLTIFLFGCAPSPKVLNMVPSSSNSPSKVYTESLKKAISVQSVIGGKETKMTPALGNVSFFSALEQALRNDDLLAVNDTSEYGLNVEILSVHKPSVGFDMTVSIQIKYVLENFSQKILYNKIIRTSYTAKFSNTYDATRRLRLAIEGASKMNIGKFLTDLSEL